MSNAVPEGRDDHAVVLVWPVHSAHSEYYNGDMKGGPVCLSDQLSSSLRGSERIGGLKDSVFVAGMLGGQLPTSLQIVNKRIQ